MKSARPLACSSQRGYQDPRAFAALLRELDADQRAGTLRGRKAVPAPAARDADLVALRRAAEQQLDRFYDEQQGGWGRKQKYPLAALDELALLRARVLGEAIWQERALITLGNELRLIDPVWGGMYQYSVAGVWDRPHFEKIGAIQAGALEALALAYRRTGDPRWQQAAHLQRGYLLGPMQDPGGASSPRCASCTPPSRAPTASPTRWP